MRAHILSIGDEILLGEILDTNSAWLADRLTGIGIQVERILSVGDRRSAIINALASGVGSADIIVLTGGLGPTSDDVTTATLAELCDVELVRDADVAADIEAFLRRRGIDTLSQQNNSQTLVPRGCRVLRNGCGTAPGIWLEKRGTAIVALPGVPHEMKEMVDRQVVPIIKERFDLPPWVRRTVLTAGIPEARLAEMLEGWEGALPNEIRLAYLPSPGIVKLRLTATGGDRKALQQMIDEPIRQLEPILGNDIFGANEDTMAEVVGRLLRGKGATLATAESCTGGNIAHLITSVPGSSDYYVGSILSYADRVKCDALGVDPTTIEEHGAVSREVVEQMAAGVRNRLNSDYSIATSGIAGPGGGTDEKPVGTTWIAVASPKGITARRFLFGELRDVNIQKSSITGLDMLRRALVVG